MGNLGNIMRNHWQHFEAHIPSVEWANALLDIVERSGNLIMHSGQLGREDVERIGINIRDWLKQVGTWPKQDQPRLPRVIHCPEIPKELEVTIDWRNLGNSYHS